jgi:hypothetical protein
MFDNIKASHSYNTTMLTVALREVRTLINVSSGAGVR